MVVASPTESVTLQVIPEAGGYGDENIHLPTEMTEEGSLNAR